MNNRNMHRTILFSALLFVLCVSCGKGICGEYIVEKRIICLAPNLTEICYALGLEKNILAVTDNCTYPERACDKPQVGPAKDLNTSMIRSMYPNLIFSSARVNDPEDIKELIEHGFSVTVTSNDTVDEILSTIRLIGQQTDTSERAHEIIHYMKTRIHDIRALSKQYDTPRILVVFNTDPVVTCRRGSIIDQLINIAGGDNIAAYPDVQSPFPDLDKLIKHEPQVIIELQMDTSDDSASVEPTYIRWSKWQETPAIKQGKVYVLPAAPFLSGSPRIIDALEMIAAALYPEHSKELLNQEHRPPYE